MDYILDNMALNEIFGHQLFKFNSLSKINVRKDIEMKMR